MLIVDPIFDVGRNGWAWQHDVDNVASMVAAVYKTLLRCVILILYLEYVDVDDVFVNLRG